MSFTSKDALVNYLAVAGLIWYTGLWSLSLLGCWTARKRYRLRPRSPLAAASRSEVPGVSILRPLKGLDTNLYENLESTFNQDYPNFEIIFSVADENDQALPVVSQLIAKYPQVDVKVIIGEEVVGMNPKVNNLMKPYDQAANDILWVLDSNVQVDRGTLARSVDILNPTLHRSQPEKGKRIALVHHVPFAFAAESRLGSRMEEAFLNTNHAKMYIGINAVALDSCVVGKSNLYRRSDIKRLNGSRKPHGTATVSEELGLSAFGKFLAEDNMIASALWHEFDLRHDLSCDVARNVVGSMSVADYIWRRVRWIRVRKHMVLTATLLEPFTESMVLCAIASASLRRLFDFPSPVTILLHYMAWIWVDLDVYTSLAGHPLSSSMCWEFSYGWVARELLALPIYLLAVFGDEVIWRGRRYRITRDGQIAEKGDDKSSWTSRLTAGAVN